MIKKHFWLFIFILLIGCESSKPTDEMIELELKRIDFIIKYSLGDDYFMKDIKFTRQYFVDKMKNEYRYFNINNK